jgi:hypothetical protein
MRQKDEDGHQDKRINPRQDQDKARLRQIYQRQKDYVWGDCTTKTAQDNHEKGHLILF